MWWALVVWDDRAEPGAVSALFSLAGVAAFLTWPVWTGPPLVVLAGIMLLHGERSWTARLRDMAVATIPMAIVAVIHGSRHVNGFRMIGTGGFAIWPTPDVLGWWYLTLAAAGVLYCATARHARAVTLLVGAIAAQAAALTWTAYDAGAVAPYLALKMCYLVIYPLGIAIAMLLAAVWRVALRTAKVPARLLRAAGVGPCGWRRRRGRAAADGRPRPRPVVTQATLLAAEWARTQAAPACIDYLVADSYTGTGCTSPCSTRRASQPAPWMTTRSTPGSGSSAGSCPRACRSPSSTTSRRCRSTSEPTWTSSSASALPPSSGGEDHRRVQSEPRKCVVSAFRRTVTVRLLARRSSAPTIGAEVGRRTLRTEGL